MLKYFHNILLNEGVIEPKKIYNSQSLSSDKLIDKKTKGEFMRSFPSFDSLIKLLRFTKDVSVQPENMNSNVTSPQSKSTLAKRIPKRTTQADQNPDSTIDYVRATIGQGKQAKLVTQLLSSKKLSLVENFGQGASHARPDDSHKRSDLLNSPEFHSSELKPKSPRPSGCETPNSSSAALTGLQGCDLRSPTGGRRPPTELVVGGVNAPRPVGLKTIQECSSRSNTNSGQGASHPTTNSVGGLRPPEEFEYSFNCPQLLTLAKQAKLVTEDTTLPSSPTISGLGNCDRIIPEYYLLNKLKPGELFEIDYYEIIKDDIRNMRPLSLYQIKYIKDLSDEETQEIIELFNESMKSLVNTLMMASNPTSPVCSIRIV